MHGPLASTLEIDKVGISLCIQHYITCLEVAVHEGCALNIGDVARHKLERSLQLHLMKVHIGSLQEQIFKVIKVEKHIGCVHLRLRIATREVEVTRATYLHVGQCCHRTPEQLPLKAIVAATCIASTLECIVERLGAKVGLQIAHAIIAHTKHFGHRQPAQRKMARQIAESLVFLLTGAHNTNYRRPALVVQAEILSVASRSRKCLTLRARPPKMLAI